MGWFVEKLSNLESAGAGEVFWVGRLALLWICQPGVVIDSGGGRAVALHAAGLGEVVLELLGRFVLELLGRFVAGTSLSKARSRFKSFDFCPWEALGNLGFCLRFPQFFLFAFRVERMSFRELLFFPGGPHLIPVFTEKELAGVLG